MLGFELGRVAPVVIRVIGVGRAGGSAINKMIAEDLTGVEFIAVGMDIHELHRCKAPEKIQIEAEMSRGLGAYYDPQVGAQAATTDRDRLKRIVKGADMVFIIAGSDDETGIGASPVIAELSREASALTVGLVVKPLEFGASTRVSQTEKRLKELRKFVDVLITVPNQKLLKMVDRSKPLIEDFSRADDMLHKCVQSISDLIKDVALLNVDFADVHALMSHMGSALMGMGMDSGENRAVRAAEKAMDSLILGKASLKVARGVLVNISGGPNLGMQEVQDVQDAFIQEAIDPDASFAFGVVVDEKLGNKVRVTFIATGLDDAQYG